MPENLDGRGLVRRAQEGDLEAFEALYRENVGRVYALCVRLTGSRSAAEDLTQEVFVRAWRKLGQFRGEAAFGTWLYRVAVNVVMSERRTGPGSNREELTDDPAALEPTSQSSGPEVGMDLERAIATLPPGARQVFVLHDVEGHRHEEIARLVGIAVGTSRAHLHRARARLREVLQ
ncbi:MAG TPA: sigma-70 family RNA polymerase sigma factor [Thermoanaerobaculaceae bacterium]|nr:sigma-70 family RNA polymerase sigma factor [Acidobacteriota bacterium]NLH12674.1 sigma-70 family RNA polymerase sigma factor [Holophagae bacterium]HPW55872.1 sigma-70 family RNA polymerase sigma factor [Thermoanaerobaculaceae bacterium]